MKSKSRKGKDQRSLADLVSVGPRFLEDFHKLVITSVTQLAKQDPLKLYEKLCRLTDTRQDPCVLDTFSAAIAQAKNPGLSKEKCQWWYWSRVRKRKQVRAGKGK